MPEDPETRELREEQADVESDERRRADESSDPDATETHDRRADKAAYLREKLDERARSEREQDP